MIDERKKIEPVSVEIKEKNEVSIVRNLTAQIMAVIEKTECTYWDVMKALDTLKEYYELKGTQFLDNASIQEVATFGVLPKQEAGKDCQEEGEKRKIEPVSVEVQGKDGVRTVCKLVSQIAAIHVSETAVPGGEAAEKAFYGKSTPDRVCIQLPAMLCKKWRF